MKMCVDSSRPNEMEDELKKIKSGRRPQFKKKRTTTSIKKWKTTPLLNLGANLSWGWLGCNIIAKN
jgi:hypothetical protein